MSDGYFLTICLNPTLQKTIVLPRLWENEVNRSDEYYLDASGKGINASRVLVQLGEPVIHLTHAGGRNRELLSHLVAGIGIDMRAVESGSEIRYCYTLINREKRTTTEIVEESVPVEAEIEQKVVDEFYRLLSGSHTVIISGTRAAGYSGEIFPSMVRDAKKAGKIVILDFRGDDLERSLPYKPDIIKPNLSEFISTFLKGFSASEQELNDAALEQVKEKMTALYRQSGIITVLTMGKHGALFMDRGHVQSIAAQSIEPVNTIGCGDAFTAGLASCWRRDHDIEKAVMKGMECAKMNALLMKPGSIR
jgi:1-phosphofructokinase/tagatose 6-phosphate kinase